MPTPLKTVLGHMADHSRDGALHFVCMDWRHMSELLAAGEAVYTGLKNLCVWDKGSGGMGSLYRSRHELVFLFKHGHAAHLNNVDRADHGRNRTNVWTYLSPSRGGADSGTLASRHPTVKPVAMVADALLDGSSRGGIILDGFIGSGTTLIAAQRTGRRGYGLELDPHYVDLTIRLYQHMTGEMARHDHLGMSFEEVTAKWMTEECCDV